MTTKERLAAALREAGAPEYMVSLAEVGAYDDYASPHPTPIVALVSAARLAGLEGIAKRAMNGEFDATKEESDAWYEREGKHLLGGSKP